MSKNRRWKEKSGDARYKLTENGVDKILNDKVPKKGLVLQILQIYRYPIDDHFGTRTGLNTSVDNLYAFDIIVSDGKFKTKCLVVPSLNPLLNKGEMRVNSIIKVITGNNYVDELTVGAGTYFQIKQLNILQTNVKDMIRKKGKKKGITFHTNDNSKNVRSTIPLYSRQMFYLPLGNNDSMDTTMENHIQQMPDEVIDASFNLKNAWKERNLISIRNDEQVYQSSPNIKTIIDYRMKEFHGRRKKRGEKSFNENDNNANFKFKSSAGHSDDDNDDEEEDYDDDDLRRIKNAPLVGRIMNKTRLFKLPERRRKCPYYFMIDLKDGSLGHTGKITLSLWETLCPRYFNSLKPGQIIRIRGYRFGRDHKNNFEFKLNSNASTNIEVLCSEQFKLYSSKLPYVSNFELRFPYRNHNFKQIKDVIRMPVSTTSVKDEDLNSNGFRDDGSSNISSNNDGDQSDFGLFDIAGVISYVGPILRTRRLRKVIADDDEGTDALALYQRPSANTNDEGSSSTNTNLSIPLDFSKDSALSESRWIKLRDGTTAFELVILIYTNSQAKVFRNLKAGKFVAFTNLKLENSTRVYRAYEPRSMWAISTARSRYVEEAGIDRTNGIIPRKKMSAVKKAFNMACSKYEIGPTVFKDRLETVYKWWREDMSFYEIDTVSEGKYNTISKLKDLPDRHYVPTRLRPSATMDYNAGFASQSRLRDLKYFISNLHWYESKIFMLQVRMESFSIQNVRDNSDSSSEEEEESDEESEEVSDEESEEDSPKAAPSKGNKHNGLKKFLLENSKFLQIGGRGSSRNARATRRSNRRDNLESTTTTTTTTTTTKKTKRVKRKATKKKGNKGNGKKSKSNKKGINVDNSQVRYVLKVKDLNKKDAREIIQMVITEAAVEVVAVTTTTIIIIVTIVLAVALIAMTIVILIRTTIMMLIMKLL